MRSAPQKAQKNNQSWKSAAALLIIGQTFSLLGSTIVQYAISWWIVMQTNSGLTTTVTLVASTLPAALISPVAGLWADRHGRKALVIAPDVFIAVVTLALAGGFASGKVSQWVILLVLVLRSLGSGVQTPAVQAFIPDVVPEEGLLRVNSINSTMESVNMLAMPAVAAALLAVMPLSSILLIDVATAVIGVGCVAFIRVPREEEGADEADTGNAVKNVKQNGVKENDGTSGLKSIADDLREGLSYAWHHPRVCLLLVASLVICFANTAVMNLTLLLVNRVWKHATLVLGPLRLDSASAKLAADQTAFSVGMLVGGLYLSWRGSRLRVSQWLLLALAVLGMGTGTILLGVAPSLVVYLLIDFLVGVVTAFASAPTYTLLQEESNAVMRGRVFGLLTTFSSLGTPLGSLVFGPLADVIDVRLVFAIGGLLTLPAGLALLGATRKNDKPQQENKPEKTREEPEKRDEQEKMSEKQ